MPEWRSRIRNPGLDYALIQWFSGAVESRLIAAEIESVGLALRKIDYKFRLGKIYAITRNLSSRTIDGLHQI